MWHSETSILVLGASTWGALVPGSTMWSEVFAAESPLQRQLCARLPGALTGGAQGRCALGPGSQLFELPFPEMEVGLETCLCCCSWAACACGTCRWQEVIAGASAFEPSLRLQGESGESLQIFLSDITSSSYLRTWVLHEPNGCYCAALT